jgi:hypothetical protein
MWFYAEGRARWRRWGEKNFPLVNWQNNISKGYTPPTHSFQMIKDLRRGHRRREEERELAEIF